MAQILDSVIKPMLPDGKAIVVETLVYDVKAMLSALRKLRRSWKFLAGRGSGDGANKWPSVSSSYDAKLLELLDLLDDGAQELKESAEMSEDDWDHELLFDVKLEEGDRERIELQKQLEKKRKCVMEDWVADSVLVYILAAHISPFAARICKTKSWTFVRTMIDCPPRRH